MTTSNMWEYGRDKSAFVDDQRLVGYKVEATDGSIGKIDKASSKVGAQSLVVDAGSWLNSQKVMLPAGVIDRVDHDDEKVYITTTKNTVKEAPEFREDLAETPDYRQRLAQHYESGRNF